MNSTTATANAHALPGTKPSCSKYRAAPSSPGPPKAPNNFWAPWAMKITPTKERSMKFAQFLYEFSHLSSIYFHLLVRRDKPACCLRMKVPHGEGLATHTGLESCVAVR